MKKMFKAACLLLSLKGVSQNVQLHYEFDKDREYAVSTYELFKADKWGSTFLFVDLVYNMAPEKHPSAVYTEISRVLNFWGGPLGLHLEYNGGMGTFKNEEMYGAFPINNAYLIGADYLINNEDFSKIISLQILYKYIHGVQNSMQLTAAWSANFYNKKLTFSGFADFWLEKKNWGEKTSNTITLVAPSLWYNVNENLSLGGRVGLANNFSGIQGFKTYPTLGVKWNF